MSRTSGSNGSFLLRLPVIGRLIHIAAALYRLPELRGFVYGEVAATHAAVAASEAKAIAATRDAMAAATDDGRKALASVAALEQSIAARLTGDDGVLRQHAQRADVIEGYIRELSDLGYGLSRRLDDESRRLRASEDQFSTILDSLSVLNSRIDQETAPFKQSFPVALREIRRSQMLLGNAVRDMKAAYANASMTIASQMDRLGERQAAIEGSAQELASGMPALGQQLDRLGAGLAAEQERLDTVLGGLPPSGLPVKDRLDQLEGHAAANQDLRQSVGYLLQRVEFVRQELMYEMRYGSGVTNEPTEVEPRIANAEKVEAARLAPEGIRLNLGSGHLPLDGYINVDSRDLPGVDIVADVGRLPFEGGAVAEITSAHVLEHFPQERLRRVLLPYWKGLLRQGGQFRAIVPDIDAMISEYVRGEVSYESMREVVYGAQDYDGDFHYNMFTPASLSRLLEDEGFVDVTISASGRRNGICLEFEIHAKRD